jgi:hypothetical protein
MRNLVKFAGGRSFQESDFKTFSIRLRNFPLEICLRAATNFSLCLLSIRMKSEGEKTPTKLRLNSIITCVILFPFTGEAKYVSSNYVIENMDRFKGGTYICTANNGVGQTASSQIALHVLCK